MSIPSPLLPISDMQKSLLDLISVDFKETVTDSWFEFIKDINEETYTNLLVKVTDILVKYNPIVETILPNQVLFLEVYDSRGRYVIETLAGDRNRLDHFINNTIMTKIDSTNIVGGWPGVQEAFTKGHATTTSLLSYPSDPNDFDSLKNPTGPSHQFIFNLTTFGDKFDEKIGIFDVGLIVN